MASVACRFPHFGRSIDPVLPHLGSVGSTESVTTVRSEEALHGAAVYTGVVVPQQRKK
ncbi:hypothetical protein ACFPVT_04190 [Corynebacterium choanae]|uniref:hypothetical protein n=1 Tax=Corynebacterium choanae TaxID=1862358 RepID=UPI0013DDBD20|nr:hypothetical protein [Corynebacterium choanae]